MSSVAVDHGLDVLVPDRIAAGLGAGVARWLRGELPVRTVVLRRDQQGVPQDANRPGVYYLATDLAGRAHDSGDR